MPDFKTFAPPSQPYSDVMFFNAGASHAHLFETAHQRMSAALDLLQLVEQAENGDFVQREAARLSFAVGLLLGDARSLYEAAHERVIKPGDREAAT
jgi:hypothetical protein